MYINEYDKSMRYNDIIRSIKVESDHNLREILDSALSYQYADAERPIEFRERDIKRYMVNSIRHNYSNYEDGLKQIYKLKMHEDMYYKYKNIVLNQISEKYPFLKDECESQKHKLVMVRII